MKIAFLLSLLFFSTTLFAAIDISFSNNSWSLDQGASLSNSEVTIVGDQSKYIKVSLVKTVDPNIKNLYFVAEIFMANIAGGPESHKWPKFKIYNDATSSNILAYNMDENIEGKWVTTGMVIEQFNKKNASQIRVEFGFQNATGTMMIRNPQLLETPPTSSYSFPFDIPADPTCTIAIESSKKHNFENDLLSANSHFSWASYTWSDNENISCINTNFPMSTMRFPGGTVGNFYKYSTDGYHGDSFTFMNQSRENAYNNGFTFDYPGYKSLCLANNASSVLMFNVVQDHIDTSKSRLQNRLSDGLNVSWIEMGNENFFTEQGLGNVNSLSNYISHTTSLASGLKQIDPNIKVAVNIEHDNYQTGSWNEELSKLNYYDATVMHPYVNTNTFMLNDVSANVMLSAFKTTTERIANYNTHFPGTPLLFTEWSILSSSTPVNFIQTLSLADMFLAIEKGNQDGIVKQAGIHMFYHSDKYGEATLAYYDGTKMVLTAAGVMYAELFDAFKDKEVFDAVSSSSDLQHSLPAVNAKAIKGTDSVKVFVVNKLPVSSPINITYDGIQITNNYSIKYFHEDPSIELTTPYATKESPWKNGSTASTPEVPAYSIAVISFKESDIITSQDDFKSEKVKVYPTLVEDELYFSKKVNAVHVYAASGALQFSGFNCSSINVSTLSPGNYYLLFNNNSSHESQEKFIKQ